MTILSYSTKPGLYAYDLLLLEANKTYLINKVKNIVIPRNQTKEHSKIKN